MTTKTIQGYLVVNWDDETLKALKNEPRKSSPYTITLAVDLEIEVPEVDTPTISEKLVVPQPTVERLVQAQVTGQRAEEWHQDVDDYLQARIDADEPIRDEQEMHQALGEVLLELEGAHDPEQVLEYLREAWSAAVGVDV